jgi:hypothetical protein
MPIFISMSKLVPPSTAETALNCPHCGAFTTQYWHRLRSKFIGGDQKTPLLPKPEHKAKLKGNPELNSETIDRLSKWIDKMATGLVFFDAKTSEYLDSSRAGAKI